MIIDEAVRLLVSDPKMVCVNNDYNRITWEASNTQPLPSFQALQTAWNNRVIELPKNWDNFYSQFEDSTIDEKLRTSTNQTALTRLQVEFGKRPNIDLTRLKKYWNQSVNGLVVGFIPSQVTTIRSWITNSNLPITLGATGLII